MILECIDISNIFTASKLNPPVLPTSKSGRSFAAIFRNSMKENTSATGSPIGKDTQPVSDSTTDKIGQLASETENKYCSMCGSRIKEDGTCPICLVPVFISGNPGSHSQRISQANSARSISENRVILSYNHRKF